MLQSKARFSVPWLIHFFGIASSQVLQSNVDQSPAVTAEAVTPGPAEFIGGRVCDPSYLPEVGCPLTENGVDWVVLLAEACRFCKLGEPCAEQPVSDSLVVEMEKAFKTELAFSCVPGILAALVISVQFYLVKTDVSEVAISEVEPFLREPQYLFPFPFHTSQYTLHANMIPARMMLCGNGKVNRDEMFNKYVPRVHPESTGRCGMVYDDQTLVYKCRSRRPFVSVPQRKDTLDSIKCPGANDIALESDLAERLSKYGHRASDPSNSCQSSKGMWREPMSDVHKCVLVTIGNLLDFRPGHLILDWGSGCGHKLTWAKALFDADGVGVDVEGGAVNWASRHSSGVFCHADGRKLGWLPDGSFDRVISYAALYHLSPIDQCTTAIQLVQKLRVGGRAWFGWNKMYSMDGWQWRTCLLNASAVPGLPNQSMSDMEGMTVEFEVIEDGFLFPPSTAVAGNHYLFQYPAFSVFLTRLG